MNKKSKILIGTAFVVPAITAMVIVPLAINRTNGSQVVNKNYLAFKSDLIEPKLYDSADEPTIKLYNPINGPTIDPGNAKVLRPNIEEVRDPNKWYSDYKNDEFKNYDAELAFNYAKEYGWSELGFDKFLRYHYEVVAVTNLTNQFGKVESIGSSWLGWNQKSDLPGHHTMIEMQGNDTPIAPSWDGAERVKANNIDNNLNWYAYDDTQSTFLFDQNNLENAFNRLKDKDTLNRLEWVKLDQISSEEGTDASGKKIKRNGGGNDFVMLNGQLTTISDLPTESNYYYVTKDGQENYIRDENGWKVIVSDDPMTWHAASKDEMFKKFFTTVLNPINKDGDLEKFFNAAGNITDSNGNEVRGPKDKNGDTSYKDNSTLDYGKYTSKNLGKAPIKDSSSNYDLTDSNVSSMGVYKLAYKENTWLDLCANPSLILPNQIYSGGLIATKDRVVVSTQHNAYEGGDMDWAWVEDGNGGHKIYKKVNIMSPRTWLTRPTKVGEKSEFEKITNSKRTYDWEQKVDPSAGWQSAYEPVKSLIYDNIYNPSKRFWGNYNHLFWDKEAFLLNQDFVNDGGY